MKRLVEEDIHEMEEDQDLLLYYSLMDFRHQMMLQHLTPVHAGNESLQAVSFPKEIEEAEDEMTGLLGYYFHFSMECMHLPSTGISKPFPIISMRNIS